jgi:hypothetical protein
MGIDESLTWVGMDLIETPFPRKGKFLPYYSLFTSCYINLSQVSSYGGNLKFTVSYENDRRLGGDYFSDIDLEIIVSILHEELIIGSSVMFPRNAVSNTATVCHGTLDPMLK